MVEVRAPAWTLSSQAVSNSELCSAPCWCPVKVCSLQSLEGYDSRRVRVRTLCTWHKRILYSNFLSETGHPASFVCFLETSSRNLKIHHIVLDPSRCLWKVLWNLMSCKEKDLAFRMWYFLLALVPKLLAWEVGLDALSAFHG